MTRKPLFHTRNMKYVLPLLGCPYTLSQKNILFMKLTSIPLTNLLFLEYSDDVQTLKRLLRDVFSDLVKVRARLEEVENSVGITASQDPNGEGTPVPHAASTSTSSKGKLPVRYVTTGGGSNVVSGVLEVGGGLLWADEDVDPSSSGAAVKDTGVRLGTDLLMRIGATVRGGSDVVMAECKADPVQETMSLQKVLYNFKLSNMLRLVMAPFGAKAQDVAYTLNPVAGRGLTSLVKHGSPLHQHVLGSLFGAAIDLRRAWVSTGYFSQGESSETDFERNCQFVNKLL